jgi:tetratricopeptide (TPR) repeat protein
VAIALPGEDRLPVGPRRDFFEALHGLYNTAGLPSGRIISTMINKLRKSGGVSNASRPDLESVSHETVSSVLRGEALSSWAKVRSIVTALVALSDRDLDTDDQITAFQELWLAARSIPDDSVLNHRRPASRRDEIGLTPTPVHVNRIRSDTGGLSARVRRSPFAVPPLSTLNERVTGGLPDRNHFFTGRELLLDQMHERLEENPTAPLVLFGLGGAGKTQLAREYVQRYLEEYSVVWWVAAESARTGLADLAEPLKIARQRSVEQTVAGVISRLESPQLRYLLVFDGVEDNGVRQLLPTIGGNVILTSRNPAVAHDSANNALEVPDFDQGEARQFLRKRGTQLTGEMADRLAHAFGRLPLALEQAAALQEASGLRWEELLDKLDQPRSALTTSGAPAHYPRTVAAMLELALAQLDTANLDARLAFELFAWFGSEPVSIALLRGGRNGDVSVPLARALRDPVRLSKAVADISRYGLARVHAGDQRIEVQPLMRLALRDVLPPAALETALHNVQKILATADPGSPDELPSMDLHRQMAPHVMPAKLIGSGSPEAQVTVFNQIRYRYLIGDYQDACRLGEAAVRAWQTEDFLGPDHELVLRATREWANALRALGQYEQSRTLTEDARQRMLANADYGEDHPHTLVMTSSYAADCRIAGEYNRALEVDRETHDRYSRKFGETSSRTISSGHNLAVSLRLVGDFRAAARSDRDELVRHQRTLGPEHVKTLASAHALAEDLYGLGRYGDVVGLYDEYFGRPQRSRDDLRPTHSVMVLPERTLALAKRRLGELADAAERLRAHYHRCSECFGPDHEYTLAAMMSYANILRQRGAPGLGYDHAADAATSYRRNFGAKNPLTLVAEVNRAVIFRARGNRDDARKADTIARDALGDVVGHQHPYFLAATVNLATDSALAGDLDKARELSEYSYEVAMQVRGERHYDTLVAGANLAADRMATGDPTKGGELLEQVLTGIRRELGQAHPMVADVAGGVRIEVDIDPPSA